VNPFGRDHYWPFGHRPKPPPPPDDVTWLCHVCGDERPDAVIAVSHQPVAGMEELFPDLAHFNVRYCTDRPVCVLVASRPDWRELRKVVQELRAG
jgi:hypothetical protein